MPLADRALVVGINRYPAIGPLKGAEADAKDFHGWVIDPAGGAVEPANASLILSSVGASEKVKDALPARHQIEDFFADVDACANDNAAAGALKAGTRLYMFFSGHGFAPSFDRSAVLMANATLTSPDNFACRLWADRLFEGGWFDEIVLFQDACRNSVSNAELMPSFFKMRNAPGKWRFYASGATNGKVSLEKPDGSGGVRGIFSLTLMEGLRGAARDPQTKEITDRMLKAYLQDNMRAKLSAAEQQDEDVAKVPDVFNPDQCVIVRAGAFILKFPVTITLPTANLMARVKDWTFVQVAQTQGAQIWNLELPIGYYKIEVEGHGERLFEVKGATRPDGSPEIVNVSIA
jgi:caspase domain-containing protein